MTSSFCTIGDCLRVRPCPETGGVWLSSTRRPGREVLIDADEFAAHLADVKAGEYDTDPQVNARRPSAGDQTPKIHN